MFIKTSTIHRQFESEGGNERADFLWRLYLKLHGPSNVSSYLDIGTWNFKNIRTFEQNLKPTTTVALDIEPKDRGKTTFVVADATYLPFRRDSFSLVTMLSVIEHLADQTGCLAEVLRVAGKGCVFLQIPNRYFPIELHTGIPFYFYLPRVVRPALLTRTRNEWAAHVNIPSVRRMKRQLSLLAPNRKSSICGFYYPENVVPKTTTVRIFHRIFKWLHLFSIFPMGYTVLVRRQNN